MLPFLSSDNKTDEILDELQEDGKEAAQDVKIRDENANAVQNYEKGKNSSEGGSEYSE